MITSVNADTYYAFGYASMQIKEYEEGAGALKKAIEMNPAYYYAQSLVGDCYRLAGKPDLARVEYKKDIERDPTRALMSRIGLIRLDIAEQPNNADVWFKFGVELKKAIEDEKGFNEAKKAFNETMRINPSYKGAHYELGHLYEQTYYIANYLDMARLELNWSGPSPTRPCEAQLGTGSDPPHEAWGSWQWTHSPLL